MLSLVLCCDFAAGSGVSAGTCASALAQATGEACRWRHAQLRRAHISSAARVLRLFGGRAEDEKIKANSEGPEHEQPALLNSGSRWEGKEELGDAMALMSSLDREIEEAEAKVAELGLEEEEHSEEDGQRSLHDGAMESIVADERAGAIKTVKITARVEALEKEKSGIEVAIERQMKELEGMGAPAAEIGNFWDTHVPIVDEEGFPRSDIPVEDVLRGRARLASLRNRYKDVMDRLQVVLGDYFASLEGHGEDDPAGDRQES